MQKGVCLDIKNGSYKNLSFQSETLEVEHEKHSNYFHIHILCRNLVSLQL